MPRWPLPLLAALVALAGCSRPALPDTIVRAASAEELASFRADLGRNFPAEELQSFDTALQELRLDALNRDVTPASAREADVCAVVHGQTLHAARILGWQARRQRLLAEIADLDQILAHDLERQKKTPTQNIADRIASAREVLARLHQDLTATNAQLAAWQTPAPKGS